MYSIVVASTLTTPVTTHSIDRNSDISSSVRNCPGTSFAELISGGLFSKIMLLILRHRGNGAGDCSLRSVVLVKWSVINGITSNGRISKSGGDLSFYYARAERHFRRQMNFQTFFVYIEMILMGFYTKLSTQCYIRISIIYVATHLLLRLCKTSSWKKGKSRTCAHFIDQIIFAAFIR